MRKNLNITAAVSKNVALEAAPRIVAGHLDCVEQLRDINERARKVLDGLAESKDQVDKQILLKACAEVRKQLGVQLELFKMMFDVTAIADFQREVLATIGACAPEVRDAIVDKLKETSALRAAVSIH